MNIIAEARRIARRKQNESSQEAKRSERECAEMRKDERLFRSAVYAGLRGMHGKDGFKVKRTKLPGPFGIVATVAIETTYIGTVCIQARTSKWRGSDESPEQDVRDVRICLRWMVNGDGADLANAYVDKYTQPTEKAIADAVTNFQQSMAHYLSNRF